MQSDTLRPALAAGLCIAALGLGAATLSNAVVVESNPMAMPGGGIDPPWSTTAAFVAVGVLFALLALAVYAVNGGGIGDKRWALKGIPVLVGIIALIIVVNHLWLTALQPPEGFPMPTGNESGGGGGGGGNVSPGGGGGPGDPVGSGNMLVTIALFGAVLVGVVAVFGAEYIPWQRDDDTTRAEVAEEASDDDESIGEAAGRAADRIESAEDSAENEVYRAWREMAESVDVGNPRTSTPAEFAAAAADAGLDRDRVAELTELFEAVRYGDRPVTEEREERAVAALREIEREHGGDER
ncbi:DUF4129 domain-containing protein [Natronoarchaeum mannanilyticum]|uniref:DUF4129 domain-containing protein n=1 Tax=Natronoarchaeum mannanilyticum TaxID=926360 RepID=UPI00360D78C5